MTAVQAQEWLACVRASGPQRLHELARWVSETDGPFDALDSSVQSLDVIWSWFLEFISNDFAGLIPADTMSDEYVAFDRPSEYGPLDYAAEALVEYVFQVIRRRCSDAEWRLFPHEDFPGVDMALENQVGVSTGGEWFYTRVRTGILARRAYRGVPQALSADRLRVIVTQSLPNPRQLESAGAPFTLRDALRFDGPVLSPPRFAQQTVIATRPTHPAAPALSVPTASGLLDAVALIGQSGNWEHQDELPALADTDLATLLASLDLTNPPGDLKSALRADDMQLRGLSGALVIETFSMGGRLRSVAFESTGKDPAVWTKFVGRLSIFASAHRMRVVRADDGTPMTS